MTGAPEELVMDAVNVDCVRDGDGLETIESYPQLTGWPWRDVNEMLLSRGLRATRQRMALGWLLFRKGGRHLTAEMLYEEAVEAKIRVSLTTVYRTLNQFTYAGLLQQISIDGGETFFDTNLNEHLHFYLESKHELIDIPISNVVLQNMPKVPDGYKINRVDIVVRLEPITNLA
uniref:Ferric uptake regulation protein n=1 Tax=Rhodopseudomonas palustris (strain BisA53) TaxID=316055 RepID=Q07LV5_RHOP5